MGEHNTYGTHEYIGRPCECSLSQDSVDEYNTHEYTHAGKLNECDHRSRTDLSRLY